MDNNKLIIGVIVAVVAFLGAPFALKALRPAPAPVPAAQPAAQGKSSFPTATPNSSYSPATAQPQMQQQQAQPSEPAQQELNAQSLVGTVWEVSAPQGTIKFQFNAGGQGVGMHAMLGQIPASWTCSGNQVTVQAVAMGKTQTLSASIQGNTLVGQGCTMRRLQ